MRRAVPAAAAVLLFASPTALAFFSGGYNIEPRLIAGMAAWLLVVALAIAGPVPLPRSLPGWLALGGLVGITAWSALSLAWAPVAGAASENVQRLLLYVAALMIAISVLRQRWAMRAVEPALAAGVMIVIGYGLSGRLLPGIIHLSESSSAGGRLQLPITYWNGEGALAAVGLVLCAHLAADRTRALWMRCLAAAATAPLGAGVYLTYSRGALAVAALGLVILVAFAPTRSQLTAAAIALVTGVTAGALSSAFDGVTSLSGDLTSRERDGAVMLVILVVLGTAAALATRWRARADRQRAGDETLPGADRYWIVAVAATSLVLLALVIGGLREKGHTVRIGESATRLTSTSSARYDYWKVGLRAFRDHPVKGLGSGGWRVYWLQKRTLSASARDVHSLELEMASELGLIGLIAFGVMIGGMATAGSRAVRRHPGLAAGWAAAALAWLLHASIDWDWELPAVTLPFLILAGALIALSEASPEGLAEPAVSARQEDEHVVPVGA
jgi:hypothetical protein